MKIVIDINENEYAGIKSFPDGNTSYPWTLHLYDAVRNGTPFDSVIGDIKAEIGARVFDIQATSDKYFDGVDDVMDIVDEIINKYIGKAESEEN